MIEINSYPTQVAQLQFEYIWIRKIDLGRCDIGSKWSQDDIW
jgi:hypothetical protein